MSVELYVELAILCIFALIGLWAVVYPAGVIGWAKRAHPILREDDPEVAFYAKFIGVAFVVIIILIFLALLLSR